MGGQQILKNLLTSICICSDSRITKNTQKQINLLDSDNNSLSVVDLAMPASTDVKNIKRQFERIKAADKKGMTVVFYLSVHRCYC